MNFEVAYPKYCHKTAIKITFFPELEKFFKPHNPDCCQCRTWFYNFINQLKQHNNEIKFNTYDYSSKYPTVCKNGLCFKI